MAPTKLDICNMALGFIGTRTIQQSELVSSPVNSPEAMQCNLYWDRARRALLTDFVCDFSVRRSALTTSSAVSSLSVNWSGKYAYPNKALKVLSVHSGADDERQPFELDYISDTQCVILTNATSPQCVYVVDVEDLSQWNEVFVHAMSLKLAILISTALLKNNPEKIKELASLYQAAMPRGVWGEGGWAVNETNTKLGVMNMALGLVGTRMITSVTENVPEAVQCSLYWDRARRSVLRDFPYRFAVRRVALVDRLLPDVYSGEWEYCYSAPADLLKVLSLGTPDDKETRQAFTVEHLDAATVILCNVHDAQCVYTADVTDPARWDEKFTAAMAAKLAWLVCNPLLKDEKDAGLNKAKELGELYFASIPRDGWEEGGWAVTGDPKKLNICNMALGYVEADMISSLTENVPEAVQCALHWDNARRSALRDFPYRFAQQRFQLERIPMPVMYARQWRYCYKMPVCLKLVRIHSGVDRIHRVPFAIELVNGEPCIFTNAPFAQATCTIDVEAVDRWDELFVQAMARKLAILIYPALKKEHRYEQPRRA